MRRACDSICSGWRERFCNSENVELSFVSSPPPCAYAMIQIAPVPGFSVSDPIVPVSEPALSWIDLSSGYPRVGMICEIGKITSDALRLVKY